MNVAFWNNALRGEKFREEEEGEEEGISIRITVRPRYKEYVGEFAEDAGDINAKSSTGKLYVFSIRLGN